MRITRDFIDLLKKGYSNNDSKRHRRTSVRLLSVVVVFCTVYMLILPALTLDKDNAESIGVYTAKDTLSEEQAETDNSGKKENQVSSDSAEAGKDQADADAAQTGNTDSAGNDEAKDRGAAAVSDKDKKTSEDRAVEKLKLTYDDEDISVTAVVRDSKKIPDDAKLEVKALKQGTDEYSAYMTALNRGFADKPYDKNNSLLFDVSVMVDGKEFEPRDGDVKVTLKFKKNQLTDYIGLDEDTENALKIIHLPVDGKTDSSSSDKISPKNIKKEIVEDAVVNVDKGESLKFSLDSLSVITVTTANTNVNINASLQGTDMQSLGYNLYAYLLASNDSRAYGAKISFTNQQASATINNVPPNTYRLYLVYAKDNRELQTEWNYNNVLDSNNNNWVDTDGGYIFGYAAELPPDTTVSPSSNTIGFTLGVTDAQSSISVDTIMDRAINYGIVGEDVDLPNNCYTNFAAKDLNIQNQNTQTHYGHRSDGIDVVPNIAASVTNNGQPLTTEKIQAAAYYVTEQDSGKVNSINQEETIVRNRHELEDRVEIMISNACKQAESLATKNMLTLPSMTSVDVSPYAKDATIILDATAISGEPNGFTIVKRPGQTVVFNINGENAAPPANIKIKLVDNNGEQIGDIHKAGNDMNDAPASDGDFWNKVIWNFPDVTGTVMASNPIGGIFLVPHGSFSATDKGGGWIVARHGVHVTNEWYGFPGNDEPFKQKIIRKTFVGLDSQDEIDPNFAIKVWTHTNESTSGTTQEMLITTLVLKPDDDPSLVRDAEGTNDQTGYMGAGIKIDEDGNYYVEWLTPPLSVGNEHKLTEINSTTVRGTAPDEIDFEGPYSVWDEATQNYVWVSRRFTFTSESEFEGIFNVSSHNEDYRQYAYVTNDYNAVKEPHDLNLKKVVVDPERLEANDQEYTFVITLKDQEGGAYSGQSVHYTINSGAERTATTDGSGKITIKLKKDDELKLLQLPYGTQYEIEEQSVPDKCSVAFSGDTSDSAKGIGRLIKDRAVVATNTYSDDPGVPVTAHKDLVGGTLREGQFTFHLIDGEGNLVQSATNDANGNISFHALVFDADGEYDYHLFEVADTAATDIIFDPTEYDVHIVVVGGRAREVTYINEDTEATTTVPMFRNQIIDTDSDKLTARKVFVDSETGKAIKLTEGEFTFTATTNDYPPVVYTGVNDENGMVTFKDAADKEVDIDSFDQPTTFVIAETDGSYTGTVEEGQTLTYDDSTHNATAEVTTTTITVNPWTQTQVDSNTTNLTLTFTPSDTSGSTYYIGADGFSPAYSEIRSDNTVTFTIPINKNPLTRDNVARDYTLEYGKGNNWWYGKQAVGKATIRIRAGEWGQAPVVIESVRVDGNTLAPYTKTEKTVKLVYEEGSYPVFTNRITGSQPEKTDFTFTKEWLDLDGRVDTTWPQDISVTLYSQKGKVADLTLSNQDDSFGDLTWTATANPDGTVRFVIKDLPAKDGDDDLVYYVQEEQADGYKAPKYAMIQSDGSIVIKPDSDVTKDRANDGQAIVNTPEGGYELPSTGGMGTKWFYAAGSILLIVSLLALAGKAGSVRR